MLEFLLSVMMQVLPFVPLAFGIAISYRILRATDMTIDGSFVLGAAIFARLVTQGVSPTLAASAALLCGALAGVMTATIQRGGRVDPLLAGVLGTFILSSVNLIIMGKPNIGLLSLPTLISVTSDQNEMFGLLSVLICVVILCVPIFLLLKTRLGLHLRAFGDNPVLFKRLGKRIEVYRMIGFAMTNLLAAGAGCLTAQSIGYADIGMGLGMTLTGIGAIILGQQVLQRISKRHYFRIGMEFFAALLGVILYFVSLNFLLRMDIDPIYLKMILGILLAFFLRAAVQRKTLGNVS